MLTKAEIQRLRSLREKKHREALGLFVIEGEKVVAELIAAQFPFVEIYATPQWHSPSPNRSDAVSAVTREFSSERHDARTAANQITITQEEMARVSHFPTPSSVLAVGKISRAPLDEGALDRGFTLALDGVQDAGNVGTLLRIADWFAFDRVLLSPDCADVFHQKVINASMGSFARVTVHTAELAAAFAKVALRASGLPILGCDLDGEDVHQVPPLENAIVVIGSEGRGLSPAVVAQVTRRVTIPRFGAAESLNAAIAGAIICDNLRRVRTNQF